MPVVARLNVMMFACYFAIGAWAMSFPTYLMSAPPLGLGFTANEVGWISSAYAIGGLLTPLVVGVLADWLFRAERVLAVAALLAASGLVAAGIWCEAREPILDAIYTATGSDFAAPSVRAAATHTFATLFPLMLVVQLGLQLCLTLTTVIALRNLPDPGTFSRTRLWGTVGWVAAGNGVAAGLTAVSTEPLYLGAGAFAALGVWALLLPATPPVGKPRSPAQAFGLPALALLKNRSFAVFLFVTFITAALHQFYGVYAHKFLTDLGREHPERDLTLGQVCEVACLFIIPRFHPRHHLKALMLVGLAGWVVRAAAMATENVPLILILGVPMHGWSFAFFQVVGAVYLDRMAPPHLRASAQGILGFVTGGAGNLAGNLFAGMVVAANRVDGIVDWPRVWLVPLVGCLASMGVFALLFRAPPEQTPAPVKSA